MARSGEGAARPRRRHGCDPKGVVNVASLRTDLAGLRAQKLLAGEGAVEDVVNTSFVEAARAALGLSKP
jgi:hypothetical protein